MRKSAFSKKGFTLVEILMVIVVISILSGIVMAASSYMTRLSRSKRLAVTKQVLETAIYRYRAEYGDWPLPENKDYSDRDDVVFSGESNKEIFGALRMANKKRNPDGIQFIDETSVFTWNDAKKHPIPLSESLPRDAEVPLIYIDSNGKYKSESGRLNCYKVTFDFVEESVRVDLR